MNAKRAAGKPADEPEQTFEAAMARLEQIVAEMEGGKSSLETMIGRFEEGQKLIAFCTAKLNEVEKKVEKLVRKGDTLATEPFDEPDDDDDDASEAEEELF